jgi:triosephosphate isomerase
MNPTSGEAAAALAEEVKAGVGQAVDVRVAICPPSIFLSRIDGLLAGSPIGLGAQNMNAKSSGAYTGEVSGPMLVDAGCTHVILGHSERRHGMGETSAEVNAKLLAALESRLIPIVCIGETEHERKSDLTESVVSTMIEQSLDGLTPEQMAGVVLAYEPVWAIGTGLTTPLQAQAVHSFIRRQIASKFGEATASRVIVQYGGSVKPDNASELLASPDIDGALVGGASLKASDFLGIIKAGQGVAAHGKA